MHGRIFASIIALSALFTATPSCAHADRPYVCAIGERVSFSLHNPPPSAIAARMSISRGVGDIPFNPSASNCQWIPQELGSYRLSIIYSLQGGDEQIARTIYCNVEDCMPVTVEDTTNQNTITISNGYPQSCFSLISPTTYPAYTNVDYGAQPIPQPQIYYYYPQTYTGCAPSACQTLSCAPTYYFRHVEFHRDNRFERKEHRPEPPRPEPPRAFPPHNFPIHRR